MPGTEAKKYFSTMRRRALNIGQKLEDALERLKQELEGKSSNEVIKSLYLDCQSLAVDLISLGTEYHNAVFASIDRGGDSGRNSIDLVERLKDILPKSDQTDGKSLLMHKANSDELDFRRLAKPNLGQAFVVWDAEVCQCINVLLTNVRSAEGRPIKCPFDGSGESDLVADGWVRIALEKRFAIIELVNRSSNKAEDVKERMKLNPHRQYIRSLGGNVLIRGKEDLLFTAITLPYAHTMLGASEE